MKGSWSYNRQDNDLWENEGYETKEEAEIAGIRYARECGLEKIEIGKCVPIPLPEYVDTEELLDRLNQQYEEEAGGEYEGDLYESVSGDNLKWLEEELSNVIREFHIKEGIKSSWYTVTSIYTINVTESDTSRKER